MNAALSERVEVVQTHFFKHLGEHGFVIPEF